MEIFGADTWLWVLFAVFVVGALAIDLGVLNRKSKAMSIKRAGIWCLIWFSLAMVFCGGLFLRNQESGVSFLAGYLVELSLSVDNLFVFIMIFEFFKVPSTYQHKILFWGIIGAVVFRAIFIVTGLQIIHHFEWVLYILGAFLILIGIKMVLKKDDDEESSPEKSLVIRLLRKVMPLTSEYHGDRFFIRAAGKWHGTPLFLVLAAVETTDVVFAMDSIPAVIAITKEPFVVFTSNIFAILGLRSMYFLLSGVMGYFKYLHYGVAAILVFVGTKMLISDFYKIPVHITLVVMVNLIFVSIVLSLIRRPTRKDPKPHFHAD